MSTSSVKTYGLQEVALEYLPKLRERAPEIEEARRLPADLSKRFGESGFYRMCVPETYG